MAQKRPTNTSTKARAVSKRTSKKLANETDGAFFLKIVLYLIIGMQWVWLVNPNQTKQVPLPLGLVLGVLFASHDHFQIDRKIEYAILLIAAAVGFWLHSGMYIIAFK